MGSMAEYEHHSHFSRTRRNASVRKESFLLLWIGRLGVSVIADTRPERVTFRHPRERHSTVAAPTRASGSGIRDRPRAPLARIPISFRGNSARRLLRCAGPRRCGRPRCTRTREGLPTRGPSPARALHVPNSAADATRSWFWSVLRTMSYRGGGGFRVSPLSSSNTSKRAGLRATSTP